MTDIASVSNERYASASSSSSSTSSSSAASSYIPASKPSFLPGEGASSVSQHRPPPLDLSSSRTTTLPRRPQSQPEMAASVHAEDSNNLAMVTPKPLLPPTPMTSAYAYHDEEQGRPRSKKRTKSIDIEEANLSNTARLSLYTPTTARDDTPRDLICLCAKAPKIPRPRNAFILYRQYWQKDFADKHPGLANPEISKLIGEKWREQPEPDKNEWKKYAEAEKLRHQKLYPNYRYQPRRGGKNGSGRPTSSNGENPGRCPKCGGRYIVAPGTPGTPGTAFSIASPPPSKRPPTMQPFMNENHSRHGSISGSLTPVDGHGRRYAQQHPRDMDEDYPMMSPMAAPLSGVPPEAKRRRYNGPPVYVPGSPHMGYTSIDSRYQQRGVAPMSATGYGPGHFPRPTMQHRPGMYAAQPNNPHMQPPPPPRQSMSYQPMVTTPSRPNSGFDESLRLPPLQTQPQESPTVSSELSARQAVQSAQHHPAPGPGPGPGSARQQPQSQLQLQPQPPPPASPMLQKWPFMLKLEVLRSISPPLRPPGPGGPHFEIRGPIIAVEGAPTPILKEVAAVIEKALSVSAEFAVRVWSEDTSTAIAHSSPETRVNGGGDANGVSDTHENETQHHNSKNGNDNTNSGNNGDAIVAAVPKKPASLVSPIASYVARMLKWHKTSEDLIRYITNYPTPPQNGGDSGTNDAAMSSRPRLPIAILSDGYSFTFSERYASALHVNDAYRADDHWQWVATLWRGIVGADLTVYVKKTAEEAKGGNANGINNSVEIVGPGIMVLHVPDGGRVDEKLERRLGFEIAEWVRGGSFVAGFKGM